MANVRTLPTALTIESLLMAERVAYHVLQRAQATCDRRLIALAARRHFEAVTERQSAQSRTRAYKSKAASPK